ncbi:MAG: N-acetylglucosamine-6-phosphate deacetylase [Dehalococcoidia bacterium]
MASRLLIRGGVLAQPGGPARADILIEGDRIVAIGRGLAASDALVIEAAGLTVGPGFIDIHVHGGGGYDFFTPDSAEVRGYSGWAPRNGVTAFLVSTLGADAGATHALLDAFVPALGAGSDGAEPLGFHLEGPFINPMRRGAFPGAMLREANPAEFTGYQAAASGHIRQVTLAPELPGALELIVAAAAAGTAPAMGHTDATVEQAQAGFAAGIRHVNHLFNAMRPIHQREAGPAIAAMLHRDVTCEVICDLAHVSAPMLRMAFQLLGANRMVTVTDNLAPAGTRAASGMFGGGAVDVSGATLVRGDGTIVGSVTTMDEQFRNVVATLGLDLGTAFRLCSTNPARVVGVERRKGAIAQGFDADLVLLDPDLQVVMTICRGMISFDARFEGGPAGRG